MPAFLRSILPWAAGLIACVIFLVVAEKPWAEGIETSREFKESIRTHSWAVIGLWWGAAINAAICGLVILFVWLCRKSERALAEPIQLENSPVSKKEKWVILFLIGAVTILGAVMMFPRLNLSLWGDEEATTRRYIVGHVYRVGENQDEIILKAPRWERTLFNWDSGPSNQVMFSVLARLCHGPGDVSGETPDNFYFSEWKIRLPSYLAGIGAILSTCWLVWLLGAPHGAPIAGFIMAMHPLIIRYGTEARGYALLLLLGPLAICFLIRALQTARLRWWISFGISQFFLLWAYFGAVYLLVPLNAAAIWITWNFKQSRNPFKSAQFLRYGGATLLGAMLTIQIMLPNLLQLPGYLERGRLVGSIDFAWVQDSLSFWIAGVPWHEWEIENPNSLTLSELGPASPLVTYLFGLLFFGTMLLGFFTLLLSKKSRNICVFSFVLVTPPILMAAHAAAEGNLLYPWYTVGFIPLGLALMGFGIGKFLPDNDKITNPRMMTAMVTFVLILFISFAPDKTRQLVRRNSVEPLAESTKHFRKITDPFQSDADSAVISISFHHYSRLYDPLGQVAANDEEFISLLKKADAENKPVWVNTAHIGYGKSYFPKAFTLLENRDVFEEPKIFWGMQQPCTRYIFKYIPGSISRINRVGS